MITVTDEQIAEWRRLSDAATPGPWRALSYGDWVGYVAAERHTIAICEASAADMDFIASVREAVPALLDEVARLRVRAEIERLQSALRIHLAVAPDDPILLTESERDIVELRAEVERLRAELAREKMISAAGWGAANANADDLMRAMEENIPEAISEMRADRLAVAERAAKAMQKECINTECWLCSEGYELANDDWHRWCTGTMLKCHSRVLREIDTAAIARRAVDGNEP